MARFLPRNLRNAWGRLASGAGADNLKNLLSLAGNPDYISFWDDYVGGGGAGSWPASQHWGYAATVGTGTQVVANTTATFGGVLTLTTGSSSADTSGQAVGLHWRGTEGIYYIAKFNLSDVTTAKFEVGLADAITGDTGMVATKATPTHTGTAYAVMAFDTTDDTNVTFISAAAGVTGANADWSGTLVNGTDIVVEIIVRGAFASGYINGQYVGGGAITAATLLAPWVFVKTNTAATRALLVDYQGCISPRSA
jgi:hypothetical protein